MQLPYAFLYKKKTFFNVHSGEKLKENVQFAFDSTYIFVAHKTFYVHSQEIVSSTINWTSF
jgi:hypothetical protein